MPDSRELNMLVLVAIAFRWSVRAIDDDLWELRAPDGRTFATRTDPSGMPIIDGALKDAIKQSAGAKTGLHPTTTILRPPRHEGPPRA